MKKIAFIFFTFCCILLRSQTVSFPDSINYQAILRDVSGTVLPAGTSGQLKFKVYSDFSSTTTVSYEENHSFTTNLVGLVNVKIGGGVKVGTNTMANVNWAAGTACYEVYLNGNIIGSKQSFATVPYALYAKNAGGAVQTGTLNQTLYWDGVKWKPTSNFTNDGTRLSIGILSPFPRRKLHVFSADPTDSSVIFSRKISANSGDAVYRGSTEGSVNYVNSANTSVIYGGDIRALNFGTGYAVGLAGTGITTNSGTAIGSSGVASGPMGSTLIGVYASADTTNGNPNAYAAFFDQGKVAVGGSLYFPNSSALPGSVYKIDAQKKGYWASASASANLTLTPSGIITINSLPSSYTIGALAPVFTSTNIGSISPLSYPNYVLNIPTPTLSFNNSTGNLNYNQSPGITNVNISPSLGLIGSSITVASSTLNIPQLNYWTKPTLTATELGNVGDNVGIGAPNPSEKLVVQTGGSTDVSIISSPASLANLNLGSTTNHFLGRVSYNTNTQAMSLWTNNTADRIFISGTGNVGVGNNVPSQKLDVAGNVVIPATNDYLYSSAKTNYLSLSSYAFISENPEAYDAKFIAGQLYACSPATTFTPSLGFATYFESAIVLPHSATITAIDAYVVDDDALYNISQVQLSRYDSPVGTPFGTPISLVTLPGTSGQNPNIQLIASGAVSFPIDNQNYHYAIRFGGSFTGYGAPGQNIRLARIRITYTVNKAN